MELVPQSDAALAQAVAWHRQVAAMVEAADRAGVAIDDLPSLRAQLAAQASTLGQAASRIGAPLPALVPSPAEVASAGANLGDLSATSVAAAIRTMRNTLAAADAALTGRPTPAPAQNPVPVPAAAPAPVPVAPVPAPASRLPSQSTPATIVSSRRVVGRNAAVYGAYAAAVLAVQAILFVLLDESSLPTAAPLCLLILPAFAWAAGWLTIGAAFDPAPDGTLERSPRLGVLVCAIPDALLLVAVLVLFVVSRLG